MSFFKRLFGGKSENSPQDNGIVKVKDLRKGWKFDYDGENWLVTEYAVYTWDNGVKDLEWEVKSSSGRTEFLNYESTNGAISMYKEANVKSVWREATQRMAKDTMDADTFEYDGETFSYLDEGYASVHGTKESYSMSNWLFGNGSKTKLVSFNKYEDNFTECYTGIVVSDNEIKNIQRADTK